MKSKDVFITRYPTDINSDDIKEADYKNRANQTLKSMGRRTTSLPHIAEIEKSTTQLFFNSQVQRI